MIDKEVYSDGINPQRMVFIKEVWGDTLWNTIATQLNILIESGYVCSMAQDELTIIIDYAPAELSLGGPRLAWLSYDVSTAEA